MSTRIFFSVFELNNDDFIETPWNPDLESGERENEEQAPESDIESDINENQPSPLVLRDTLDGKEIKKESMS